MPEDTFRTVELTPEDCWRAIILYGRNVASYKFALGKSLLGFAGSGVSTLTLPELAAPYAAATCEHLALTNKQGTSASSAFLEGCRKFNRSEISKSDLLELTVKDGFRYVLDAFHIVSKEPTPVRFFDLSKSTRTLTLTLTDDLLALATRFQFQNLPEEVEARWRLVETAWTLNVPAQVLTVNYDSTTGLLLPNTGLERRSITGCRQALNGYQKGACFYCFRDISVETGAPDLGEVDHFFPHVLGRRGRLAGVDGVWNLVLACPKCNAGVDGKFERIPEKRYLDRLHRRNEYLIGSHHPLRETLMEQTGQSTKARVSFLQATYDLALTELIHAWRPEFELAPAF